MKSLRGAVAPDPLDAVGVDNGDEDTLRMGVEAFGGKAGLGERDLLDVHGVKAGFGGIGGGVLVRGRAGSVLGAVHLAQLVTSGSSLHLGRAINYLLG
jgi:hypothetical protein